MLRFLTRKTSVRSPAHTRRVRARVDGRKLELLEDVRVPAGEVTITIELPVEVDIARALDESAGAWSDEGHPDLKTREDVAAHVQSLRSAFDRYAG